jgi:hypothetical protein
MILILTLIIGLLQRRPGNSDKIPDKKRHRELKQNLFITFTKQRDSPYHVRE